MPPIIPSISDIGKGLLAGGISNIRHDLGLVRRYTLVWFFIACFDTFALFPLEYRYVWKAKWSLAKVLFLINRWFVLFLQAVMQVLDRIYVPPDVCDRLFWIGSSTGILTNFVCFCILSIRVFALYERSGKMLGILVALTICWIGLVVGSATQIQRVEMAPRISALLGLTGCGTLGHSRLDFQQALTIWGTFFVADAIIISLTVFQSVRITRQVGRIPIVQRLRQDGAIYYLIVTVVNAISLSILLQTSYPRLKALNNSASLVLTSLMASRLVIALYHRDPTPLISGRTPRSWERSPRIPVHTVGQARSDTGESVQATFAILRQIVAKLPDLISLRSPSTTRVQHVQEVLSSLDWPRWQALNHTWPSLARSIVKNLEALVDPKVPNKYPYFFTIRDLLLTHLESHASCLDWLSAILTDSASQLPLQALQEFVAMLGSTGYDKFVKLPDPQRSTSTLANYVSRLFARIKGTLDYAEVVELTIEIARACTRVMEGTPIQCREYFGLIANLSSIHDYPPFRDLLLTVKLSIATLKPHEFELYRSTHSADGKTCKTRLEEELKELAQHVQSRNNIKIEYDWVEIKELGETALPAREWYDHWDSWGRRLGLASEFLYYSYSPSPEAESPFSPGPRDHYEPF